LNSCSFFNWNQITWELFENFIQNTFDYEYFWRLWEKEVDFVDFKDEIQAIEVKYKSKIDKKDFSWIKTFSKKFNVSKKLLISKDLDKEIDDINIVSFLRML
jgi:hypothetical protein